jgi:membrane protein YdbS with pleckstrin-like domain
MESITLKPEKQQQSLWFIYWIIPFIIGITILSILLLFADKIVFGLCLIAWLTVMLLILLWIPAFYRSLEYVIKNELVKAKGGVFWRKRVTVPLNKITNIDITQGPLERMFGIGTIHIQTAGAGGTEGSRAELKLLGIRDLEGIKDKIINRISGQTISEAQQLKVETTQYGDSQIHQRILNELIAIRKALQNKQT